MRGFIAHDHVDGSSDVDPEHSQVSNLPREIIDVAIFSNAVLLAPVPMFFGFYATYHYYGPVLLINYSLNALSNATNSGETFF